MEKYITIKTPIQIRKEWNGLAISIIILIFIGIVGAQSISHYYDSLDSTIDGLFDENTKLFFESDLLNNRFEILTATHGISDIALATLNNTDIYYYSWLGNETYNEKDEIISQLEIINSKIDNNTITLNELINERNNLNSINQINSVIIPLYQIILPITTLFIGLLNSENKIYFLYAKKSLFYIFIFTSITTIIVMSLGSYVVLASSVDAGKSNVYLIIMLFCSYILSGILIIFFFVKLKSIGIHDGVSYGAVSAEAMDDESDTTEQTSQPNSNEKEKMNRREGGVS